MMARGWKAWLALVALGLFGSGVAASDPDGPPNVVLILVDDLGYADLGCTGAKDIRTPHLDRLARDGARFTQFYSNAPVCTPTRCALMTGRWQQRFGLEWAFGFTAEQEVRTDGGWAPEPDKLKLGLAPSGWSLPRRLREAGYATGCVGKWHLGFRPEYSPNAHGFDDYFGVLLGHADYYRHTYKDGTYHLFENGAPTMAEGYLTDLFNARAVKFIETHAGRRPFFLYVPYNAVHWPFHTPDTLPPPLSDDNLYHGTRADYARMVERIDDGVGQMTAALQRAAELDNTLFIFTSDNGGERLSDNRPLFNHKTTLWEGGIRVPCLVRWPRHVPAGQVLDQPAITMDLTATVLGAAGVEPAADLPLDGIDLRPTLSGKGPPIERTFCWRVDRSDRRQKAIRHGDWKYVQDGMVGLLFNLRDDVGERRDLAYERPDILTELKRRLAAWEAEMDAAAPPVRIR